MVHFLLLTASNKYKQDNKKMYLLKNLMCTFFHDEMRLNSNSKYSFLTTIKNYYYWYWLIIRFRGSYSFVDHDL